MKNTGCMHCRHGFKLEIIPFPFKTEYFFVCHHPDNISKDLTILEDVEGIVEEKDKHISRKWNKFGRCKRFQEA